MKFVWVDMDGVAGHQKYTHVFPRSFAINDLFSFPQEIFYL
jgi:hypothetical protein